MSLQIDDKAYIEEEQYYVYDFDSFFADVGGYMGLLLGSSVLSIYDVVGGWLDVRKFTSFFEMPILTAALHLNKQLH